MSESPTESAIREFLVKDLLYDRGLDSISPDESLLDAGYLDSIGILRIVSFCEERFGVTIPDSEVLPENLGTVRSIARMVERFSA
jgi:acyl carrier protein